MVDAEALLASARRPLVLGLGGGGDVVGALATYEMCRIYHAAEPRLGGVSWERRAIDPVPGPRTVDEIEGARIIAPGVLAASADTRIRDRGIPFAESRMAGLLGEEVVLVEIAHGPATLADGLAAALDELGCDLLICLDVGGDVLAHGDEAGLGSPLCDAVVLAAAERLAAAGRRVVGAVFGAGCDGELTPGEVLERLGEVAAAGGLVGARGLTDPIARRVEEATEVVPTEASLQAVRCFRGARGETTIRGGLRRVVLSPIAAVTFFFDVEAAVSSASRLARAVRPAKSLEEANDILNGLGVTTELDSEREAFVA
jgi:hypothetical protein